MRLSTSVLSASSPSSSSRTTLRARHVARSPSVLSIVAALLLAACSSSSSPSGPSPDDHPSTDADGGGNGGLNEGQADASDGAPAEPACGRLTTKCAAGGACEGAQDCLDNVCRDGKCQAAAPADGTKNGTETDVDCGGDKAPACADGKQCATKDDCTSGVCTGTVCQAPKVDDGVKNGDETGVDCGGTKAPKCKTGDGCLVDSDCDDVRCDTAQKKCSTPSHSDNLQNGDETGIDCGGPTAPIRCATGQGCAVDTDCNNVLCDTAGTKLCKAPAHDDGLKNGDETGTDCGGPTAPTRCATGQGCAANTDCNNVLCDVAGTKLCKAPAYDDGLKNGDETGTDCGGPTAPSRCATGQGCAADADCNNVRCDAAGTKLCKAAAKDDGLKNGDETDVDCGGGAPTNAPKCASGKVCKADTDCSTDGCGYDNKCAMGRSCTVHEGGDTCGTGEVGQAGADHESCCATVQIPGRPNTWIGKYEITAGRMREFVRRTGGNVRAYIDANPTSQIRAADKIYLPEGADTPVRSFSHCNEQGTNCITENLAFGINEHLGNTVFLPDRPCANCGQGCFIGKPTDYAFGHPTYWQPDAIQSKFGANPRSFSQAILDTKSLNCTTQIMLAAFCAWDGGRLPTQDELGGATGAWGNTTWPWGNTPSAYDTLNGNEAGRIQYTDSQVAGAFFFPAIGANATIDPNAVNYNTTNFNPFRQSNGQMQAIPNFRYVWPQRPYSTWDDTDQAYVIAAPGRMKNDRRKTGNGAHDGIFDVTANLMEATGDQRSFDDAQHNSMPRVMWVGGSFEGHGPNNRGGYEGNGNILTKYGKMGGRCVYDR